MAAKCRSAGWGCLDCKRVLSENVVNTFAPIRERAAELKADPRPVLEILQDGAQRARAVAQETMREVRERMGFMPELVATSRT